MALQILVEYVKELMNCVNSEQHLDVVHLPFNLNVSFNDFTPSLPKLIPPLLLLHHDKVLIIFCLTLVLLLSGWSRLDRSLQCLLPLECVRVFVDLDEVNVVSNRSGHQLLVHWIYVEFFDGTLTKFELLFG